jgi:hypothetical protein
VIAPYNLERIVALTGVRALVIREPRSTAQRIEHDLFWSKFSA